MIIASVFFPSFLMHTVEPGLNEPDLKRTDPAGATHVPGGLGHGAEAKVGSASPRSISAGRQISAGIAFPLPVSGSLALFLWAPRGVSHSLCASAYHKFSAALVASHWVTAALRECLGLGEEEC